MGALSRWRSASFARSEEVRFHGFFSRAHRVLLNDFLVAESSAWRTCSRRTSSTASWASRWTWNRSKMICAFSVSA